MRFGVEAYTEKIWPAALKVFKRVVKKKATNVILKTFVKVYTQQKKKNIYIL